MRAIQIDRHGGPEVLALVERPAPSPGPGEALVRVEAAGVNYIDIYHRTGIYPLPLPMVPGLEGAGTVTALGPGVEGVGVGDRVAWTSVPGSYAEVVVARVAKLVPVPPGVDLPTAAAAMLQGLTAHFLVRSTYPLAGGEWCLLHAAAGGVGLLLCQLARRIGARVIGTVSTPEKAALARAAGAEETILYRDQDFEAEVLRITGGAKVSVAYDSVGRTTFQKSLACLRPRGMLVLFGQSSGLVPPIDPQALSQHGSLFLTRPRLNDHVASRAELEWRTREVLGGVAAGSLDIRIHAALPLARAAEAQQKLESRETSGKLLLIPTGEG